MKPLEYYISNEPIDQLTEKYGTQLELLDRPQKLQLRVVLTYFILGREMMSNDYSIQDAVEDFNLYQIFVSDVEIDNVLKILEGITIQDAESLLEALQAQCRTGNAKLKTSGETMLDELLRLEVPIDLATEAAYILTVVDGTRARKPSEQVTISQLHKFVLRGGKS